MHVETLWTRSGHARATDTVHFPGAVPVFLFLCISWTKAWARLVSKVAHPSALPGVFHSLAGQSYMEELERKAQVFVCSICLSARLSALTVWTYSATCETKPAKRLELTASPCRETNKPIGS